MSVTPLDSPPLKKFLDDIAVGRVQLPDFQRDWKWDDDRIRSLLATLTLGYPMGVVMTLHTGGEVRFKARPLEGTMPDGSVEPERLLLDGQQRLTSLFQSLKSGRPVETTNARGKALRRWYYVDIAKALDDSADREDAIVSVPEDKILKAGSGRSVRDLTTQDKECAEGFFPLSAAMENSATDKWLLTYLLADPSRQPVWEKFRDSILDNVANYQVPTINLGEETPKEAVCIVFEKVNTGGVLLNVFELVTATYAGDRQYREAYGHDFELREDWAKTKERLSTEFPVLAELESTDFLQAVTLVASYERQRRYLAGGGDRSRAPAVGAKRRDVLDLRLSEYLQWAPKVADALAWSADFLLRQGVYRAGDVPYRTQLIPMSAIRTVLGDHANELEVQERLTRWYWCGVLGELYSGTTETRIARDLEQVTEWALGGRRLPGTVEQATFRIARIDTLATKNSAAYKGVYALILRQGCRDWYFNNEDITVELAVEQQIEIHEVFPKPADFARRSQKEKERYTSIVNKTPLSGRASRTVAKLRPSAYLTALQRDSGFPPAWFDDVLATHLINAKHLRADDFDAYYADRREDLIKLIEEAMGKPVVRAAEGAEE